MKRIILFLLVFLAVSGGITGYIFYQNANRDFSPWMSQQELTNFLKKFEQKEGSTDNWPKTHWITAAEGRWHDGVAEFRIRDGAAPAKWEGYWFFNQDQETFGKTIKYYGDAGFTMLWSDSFVVPDGTKRYQSVWHKTK